MPRYFHPLLQRAGDRWRSSSELKVKRHRFEQAVLVMGTKRRPIVLTHDAPVAVHGQGSFGPTESLPHWRYSSQVAVATHEIGVCHDRPFGKEINGWR